jgi:catechol 2,3-dioxygenase-like lactoylglutathione lyase family enzyme
VSNADDAHAPTVSFNGVIFFYTEDVDALRPFYTDVIGFPVLTGQPHFDTPGHSYWLDAGSATLALHQAEKYLPGPYEHARSSILVNFEVPGTVEELSARLAASGVEMTFHEAGHRYLVVRDTEGRRIGLTARDTPAS